MEYNKDAENIKANDLKQSLNSEKTKNLELMEKLNQEKKKSNSLQEQLCDLKEEVLRMKDTMGIENKNYKIICKDLDGEKSRCDELKSFIEVIQIIQEFNQKYKNYFIFQHLKAKYRELEENQTFEKSRLS